MQVAQKYKGNAYKMSVFRGAPDPLQERGKKIRILHLLHIFTPFPCCSYFTTQPSISGASNNFILQLLQLLQLLYNFHNFLQRFYHFYNSFSTFLPLPQIPQIYFTTRVVKSSEIHDFSPLFGEW